MSPDLDFELLRLAFVAGIAVSLVLYERFNLTTGSVVAPGYLAASFLRPGSVLTTIIVAFLCHRLINRWLAGKMLLYGRTKFVVLALTSIVLTGLAGLVSAPAGGGGWESFAESAGYIVPALIAHDMGRQGTANTFKALTLSSGLVLIVLGLAVLFAPAATGAVSGANHALAFGQGFLPLAVLVSASTAWVLQNRLDMRAGGFVGGAYVALLSNSWIAVAVVLAVAGLSYLIVAKLLVRVSILFGRRKFAAMLLVAGVLGWSAVNAQASFAASTPFDFGVLAGFAIAPMLVPGLIANDMERVGVMKTLGGVVASTMVVLAIVTVADLTQPVLLTTLTSLVLGIIVIGVAAAATAFGRPDRPVPGATRPAIAGHSPPR